MLYLKFTGVKLVYFSHSYKSIAQKIFCFFLSVQKIFIILWSVSSKFYTLIK